MFHLLQGKQLVTCWPIVDHQVANSCSRNQSVLYNYQMLNMLFTFKNHQLCYVLRFSFTQDVHEGEVNAARFSSSGRLFASGGADRKVKIWEQVNGWADIHIFTIYLCHTKTRSTAQDLVSK